MAVERIGKSHDRLFGLYVTPEEEDLPHEPKMYVCANTSNRSEEIRKVVSNECVTLEELRTNIDNLKDKLESIYEKMERKYNRQEG